MGDKIPNRREASPAAKSAEDEPIEVEEPEAPEEPQEPVKGGNEAAKYRRQLREAEAARDAALADVRELQQALVGSAVAGRLANAEDFGKFVEFDSLLGEDGKLDQAKITESVDSLLQDRPYLAAQPVPRVAERAVPRRPAERPKPGMGVPNEPVAQKRTGPIEKKLADAFGGADGGTKRWSDLLERNGERANAADLGGKTVELELNHEQ